MAKIQKVTYDYQKEHRRFKSIQEARECHLAETSGVLFADQGGNSVEDYDKWVATQPDYSETYELTEDASGYVIVRTWPDTQTMIQSENTGKHEYDRKQMAINGWVVDNDMSL